jgi:hypothetical protein
MKYLVSMLTVAAALAFAAPAFAGPTNQEDCQAAGGTWDAETSTCTGAE